MISDLKYALRQLIKSPGFTIFALLTLALGIGANTAIFSIIDSVLLSTLPVKDPQQLVFLTDPDNHGFSVGGWGGDRDMLTYAEFQDLRDHNEVLSGIVAVAAQMVHPPVTISGSAANADVHVAVSLVNRNYFSVLGVAPALGRTFTAEVDKIRDANPVAVISYKYWRNQFGGDPAILTRKVRIQDTFYDVVGVAPVGFFGETVGASPDIWVPLSMQAEVVPGSDWLSPEKDPLEKTRWLQVIGRLKPGISLAQAKTSLNVTFQQYLESQIGGVPESRRNNFLHQDIGLVAGSHGASTLRKGYGEPLVVLMGLVGLLLLIACANVANLLLARATFRQREIAIRIAVGAKPGRIFRQLLTESMLLSLIGGGAGFVLAQWGEAALLQLVGQGVHVHANAPILIFTFAVSVLVGLLFGTAPALQAMRLNLSPVLKGTVGGEARGSRVSLGRILVVTQVAFSVLLLIVAGLFVHSFQKLASVDLGEDHDHLLIFAVDPTTSGYKGPTLEQLYRNLADRIGAIPRVGGVTFSANGFFADNDSGSGITIDGYAPTSGQQMSARWDTVAPNYFSTVGIPIVLGRAIGPQDAGSGQRYGVINQTMSRYYFGNANPIGHRIRNSYQPSHSDFIVVGVAADAKYNGVREDTPRRFYLPAYHPLNYLGGVYFEVRVQGRPADVIAAIRSAVKQAAPNLPAVDIRTMNQMVDQTLGLDHLLTKLSSLFGILAALLASIGIYGIMSYAVARRTREIGIRTALGAQHGNILWLILSESLFLVLIGVGIGVPAAIVAGKLIGSLLFGLPPADPGVLAAAVALMFVVAAFAGYVPARRAARVDPLVALRSE